MKYTNENKVNSLTEQRGKSNGIKVEYKGVTYSSIAKLAKALNIRPEYIYGRTRVGMSIEDAVEEVQQLIKNERLRSNLSDKAKESKFKIWSQNFNTISEIEVEYKLKRGLIKANVDKINNESIQRFIIEYMEPQVKEDLILYKKITVLARNYGLQPDNVHQRLKKGWSLTEALIIPIRKRHGTKYEYKGKEYESRAKLASAFNIDNYYISSLSKRLGKSWMETFEIVEMGMLQKTSWMKKDML